MKSSLDLKWGNIKGWDGIEAGTPASVALQRYIDSGQSMSAMQRQTDEQRELICAVIDVIDGDIHDDWNGRTMTKEEAKNYIRSYGK